MWFNSGFYYCMFFWVKNTNHLYSFTVFLFFLEGRGAFFFDPPPPPPHFLRLRFLPFYKTLTPLFPQSRRWKNGEPGGRKRTIVAYLIAIVPRLQQGYFTNLWWEGQRFFLEVENWGCCCPRDQKSLYFSPPCQFVPVRIMDPFLRTKY